MFVTTWLPAFVESKKTMSFSGTGPGAASPLGAASSLTSFGASLSLAFFGETFSSSGGIIAAPNAGAPTDFCLRFLPMPRENYNAAPHKTSKLTLPPSTPQYTCIALEGALENCSVLLI